VAHGASAKGADLWSYNPFLARKGGPSAMLPAGAKMGSAHESTGNDLKMHLAEYQALTQRSTGLIGQMFAVMAIGFAFLGILINNWDPQAPEHRHILWPALLVEQVIVLFWLGLRHTEIGITIYIDTKLRKMCTAKLAPGELFWQYHSFL